MRIASIGAVLVDALDDDAVAGHLNALVIQRVDPDHPWDGRR